MSNRKKILFFLPNSVGGSERVTVTVGKLLDPKEYDVQFIIVARNLGNIVSFIPETYSVKLLKALNVWEFVVIRMAVLIWHEKPYAVFSSLRYLNVRLLIASSFFPKVKTIIRNNHNFSVFSSFARFWVRLLYPLADVIVAQQEEMAQELIESVPRIKPSKVRIIYNPIDTETINSQIKDTSSPYENKTINYVCVGRISPEKGQDVLVKAFEAVHQVVPEARLYFLGGFDGSAKYYRELRTMVESLKLNNLVKFEGYNETPYVWIRFADVFVLPSRTEGLPNVLMEAMYLGTPYVATRCVPMVERLAEQVPNGLLVDIDNYRAMSEAMLMALKKSRAGGPFFEENLNEISKLFD